MLASANAACLRLPGCQCGYVVAVQLEHIERYLVVHGQILLSQIKAYPNKDVQRSQFVTSLKQKMEARRHSKLYYSKRGFSKAPTSMRAVNRNPMKVCQRSSSVPIWVRRTWACW